MANTTARFAMPGLLLCLAATAQKADPDEQRRTIDAAREIAIHYNSTLPDFICTEQVDRNRRGLVRDTASNDRLTIQLSYFGKKENYKLIAINGKATQESLEWVGGLLTGGEFGSQLMGIFDSASAADFRWKQSAVFSNRAASVYTYRIGRATSRYMVGGRDATGKLVSAPAGYKGEVVIDNQTSRVLRLTAAADDIPRGSGIRASSVEVDYDFFEVAGKTYLLPAHSASHMSEDRRELSSRVKFTDYKKFEGDSTITFK
jgi:hypothetical protein